MPSCSFFDKKRNKIKQNFLFIIQRTGKKVKAFSQIRTKFVNLSIFFGEKIYTEDRFCVKIILRSMQ